MSVFRKMPRSKWFSPLHLAQYQIIKVVGLLDIQVEESALYGIQKSNLHVVLRDWCRFSWKTVAEFESCTACPPVKHSQCRSCLGPITIYILTFRILWLFYVLNHYYDRILFFLSYIQQNIVKTVEIYRAFVWHLCNENNKMLT